MDHKRLEIANNSGEKLVCIEVKPTQVTQVKLPVVILCHGFAYFKEEDGIFTEVAKRLASKGYAVYYFDFSGCGESEGNYKDTTLTKLVGDLKSVYNTVTSFDYVDKDNVSLMGHSFGSIVILAAQIPSLKRIVLSSSFYNPRDIISKIFPDFNESGVSTRNGSRITTTIGPQFWQDLKQYNLPELIKNFECPIMFIHGQLDNIVPIESMQPLLASAKHPEEPVVLDKSDHDLIPQREMAFEAIEKFFSI